MIQCNDIHKREREIEGSSIDQIQDVKHEPINNSTYNSNKNLKVFFFYSIYGSYKYIYI